MRQMSDESPTPAVVPILASQTPQPVPTQKQAVENQEEVCARPVVEPGEDELVRFMRGFAGVRLEPRPYPRTFRNGVPPEFRPFFESGGELATLAEALKKNPFLLWHPMVFRIIRHLLDVRSEYGGHEYADDAAQTQLRLLIEATASGLLGGTWGLKPPGWSLKPPPGRRGRKTDEYLDAIEGELWDGNEELKKFLRGGLVQRGKHESEDQQIQRVITLVRDVWARSSLGREWDHDNPFQDKECPPPPTTEIMKWVRWSFDRCTETGRSIRAQLAWRMLAYRYGLRVDQVRGRLDAVRKLYGNTTPAANGFVPRVRMPSASH